MKKTVTATADHYEKELSKVPPHTPDLLNLAALDTLTRRAVQLVIHRMDDETKAALIHAHNIEAIFALEPSSMMTVLFPACCSNPDISSVEHIAEDMLYGFEPPINPEPWQLNHVGVIARLFHGGNDPLIEAAS